MVACVSGAGADATETLSTLQVSSLNSKPYNPDDWRGLGPCAHTDAGWWAHFWKGTRKESLPAVAVGSPGARTPNPDRGTPVPAASHLPVNKVEQGSSRENETAFAH